MITTGYFFISSQSDICFIKAGPDKAPQCMFSCRLSIIIPNYHQIVPLIYIPGPSCSNLTPSLINKMLNFLTYCIQNIAIFC